MDSGDPMNSLGKAPARRKRRFWRERSREVKLWILDFNVDYPPGTVYTVRYRVPGNNNSPTTRGRL